MPATAYTSTKDTGNGGIYPLSFHQTLSTVSAADVITEVVMPHAFKLVRVDMVINAAVTTGSKNATITPKIDGTAVTGGALALTSANCTPKGKVLTVTPTDVLVGGNNIAYAAGSKLSFTASSVTAFVEGSGELVAWVQALQ